MKHVWNLSLISRVTIWLPFNIIEDKLRLKITGSHLGTRKRESCHGNNNANWCFFLVLDMLFYYHLGSFNLIPVSYCHTVLFYYLLTSNNHSPTDIPVFVLYLLTISLSRKGLNDAWICTYVQDKEEWG
jgi:hypothetical protein